MSLYYSHLSSNPERDKVLVGTLRDKTNEIAVLREWPEHARKQAEIEAMFNKQQKIAEVEDARREKIQKKRMDILFLYDLLTSREVSFLSSFIKKYCRLKRLLLSKHERSNQLFR